MSSQISLSGPSRRKKSWVSLMLSRDNDNPDEDGDHHDFGKKVNPDI